MPESCELIQAVATVYWPTSEMEKRGDLVMLRYIGLTSLLADIQLVDCS